MAGLSLLDDIVFKIVFGTGKNVSLLRALLNALLSLEGEKRIVDLEILNPYQDKQHLLEKGVILDVKARDGERRLYNIEVQVAQKPAYVERALYYLARLFAGQLDKGDAYTRLARTIGISLVDFVLFPETDELHSRYRLYDERQKRELSDILELHFIELAKFRRDRPEDLRTPAERWLHVLKFGELYEASPESMPEPLAREEGIEMAIEEMRRASSDSEVRELVEQRMKALRDMATDLEHAELKGLEKGLEKGVEKGREEGRRRLVETARRLREEGMTLEMVTRVTGLSTEDLDS